MCEMRVSCSFCICSQCQSPRIINCGWWFWAGRTTVCAAARTRPQNRRKKKVWEKNQKQHTLLISLWYSVLCIRSVQRVIYFIFCYYYCDPWKSMATNELREAKTKTHTHTHKIDDEVECTTVFFPSLTQSRCDSWTESSLNEYNCTSSQLINAIAFFLHFSIWFTGGFAISTMTIT